MRCRGSATVGTRPGTWWYDQVYRGAKDEWRWANKAIEATRGQVLWSGGEPAEVYYASTCGGATTDIHEVWNHGPVSHLSSVRDNDSRGRSWCRSSKYFRWTHTWSARDLGKILRAYLPEEVLLDGRYTPPSPTPVDEA